MTGTRSPPPPRPLGDPFADVFILDTGLFINLVLFFGL